jgi:hypothetical protein
MIVDVDPETAVDVAAATDVAVDEKVSITPYETNAYRCHDSVGRRRRTTAAHKLRATCLDRAISLAEQLPSMQAPEAWRNALLLHRQRASSGRQPSRLVESMQLTAQAL